MPRIFFMGYMEVGVQMRVIWRSRDQMEKVGTEISKAPGTPSNSSTVKMRILKTKSKCSQMRNC